MAKTVPQHNSVKTPTQLIILGAGRPTNYVDPLDAQSMPAGKSSLDWIHRAVSNYVTTSYYVAGYHANQITPSLSGYNLTFNKDWETTGSVGSLLCAPLLYNHQILVCYHDIVFRSDIVRELVTANYDVVIAIDGDWKKRYPRRTSEDLAHAEKVVLYSQGKFIVDSSIDANDAVGEFIGLCKLSKKAIDYLTKQMDQDEIRSWSLPQLLSTLSKSPYLTSGWRNVQGEWAELNAPQDLARFVFGTKAETLERLQPLVKSVHIKDQVRFTVADWFMKPSIILSDISRAFGSKHVIVRSSALSEDSWASTNAGAYKSILDVPSNDAEVIRTAIHEVISSYGSPQPEDQVLIQPMLSDVKASGVTFTRSLTYGAPYFVINFDATNNRTDSVTGSGTDLEMLVVHHDAERLPDEAPPWADTLIEGMREIIGFVGHDSLDLEFAVGKDGKVYILQVRPIAVDHSIWSVNDNMLKTELHESVARFESLQHGTGHSFGNRAIFGVMPDWNPAEIVGTRPTLLAISLYRYLICDEIWARQRAEYGYKDVRPQPLIVSFAGHPYVNIRASFSSLVPALVPEGLAHKLVSHYMDRLEANPSLHDKIEFDIAITCISFDFDQRADEQLRPAGFTDEEIKEFKNKLTCLTCEGMARLSRDLAQIETLQKRYENTMTLSLLPLERACLLLEDCREYGTLAFSHIARSAFIASTIMRSAVTSGLITEEDLNRYLESISTVAKEFIRDINEVSEGIQDWSQFLNRYGFLRPNTYDIESLTYRESAETILKHMVCAFRSGSGGHTGTASRWPMGKNLIPRDALSSLGLDGDFDAFARNAIQGREYAKFVFSRNLSQALNDLASYGAELGIERHELSNLSIETFRTLRAGEGLGDPRDFITKVSSLYAERKAVANAVELPPLIFNRNQFFSFFYPPNQPNFVTAKSTTGPVYVLDCGTINDISILKGKIVAIPQADPGFDWLFGCGIIGLVTMYGGANSHMAIRSAEFGLPAAIGVGEVLFEKLRHAQVAIIDCSQRNIKILK